LPRIGYKKVNSKHSNNLGVATGSETSEYDQQ